MAISSALHMLMFLLCLLRIGNADFASDRTECADQLVGLATCLTYVEGAAKAPTPDCCTGLKGVLEKSKKCLCVLIKDHDQLSLGVEINTTLAASLPSVCHEKANISHCPRLLNLPSGSKDAEIFEQLGNASIGSAAPAVTSNGNGKVPATGSEAHVSGVGRSHCLGVFGVEGWIWSWSLVVVLSWKSF